MRVRLLYDGFILSFLIFLLIVSIDYPPKLKLLPWIFISLAIIFLVWQILKDMSTGGGGDEKLKSELTFAQWVSRLRGHDWGYLKAMVWIAALFSTLYVLGFVITTPLFTILYLKSHGETWRLSVGLSVMVWGIFFGIFGFVLDISLYEGVVFSFLKGVVTSWPIDP